MLGLLAPVSLKFERTIPSLEYRLTHTLLKHRGAGALRLVGEGNTSAKPVVVLHGLGSSKQWTLPTLYALATAGFDAVALDLFLHGERPEAETREQMLSDQFVAALYSIIYETAADVPILCEELGVDVEQAGLLGISAGGFAAHAVAVANPRCRALVAAISSPDWLRIDPSRVPDPNTPAGMQLEAASPVNSPERYAPLPVCLLNVDTDDVVSPIGSKRLYERLTPIYEHEGIPKRLKMVLYPDGGHVFTDDMLTKTVEWFLRYV